MIRTLIVDDEPLAGEILETYIFQLPNMQLVGRCFNALEANEMLQNEKVDLLLLDIEMPILRGVDFLKQLSSPPLVIFTTAYPEFAVEGFNLNAIDYLLKPISFERFLKAINKVTEKLKLQAAPEKESSFQDYIFVKADKKLVASSRGRASSSTISIFHLLSLLEGISASFSSSKKIKSSCMFYS